MTTEKASNIPGNFITHRPSWREALVIAKEHAKTEADASYWQHEINAFDRSFDRLWELMRTSPTAEQQIKKPNVVLELPDGDTRVANVFFSEMKGDTLHLCITVTVEIEDDEVLVAIKRPEEYKDVPAQLLVEDIVGNIGWAEWRVIESKENT